METELWPNLLAECAKRQIPVVIANGRLSPHSLKQYQRYVFLKPLLHQMLAQLSTVCAQSAREGEHFLQLGLSPGQLVISGNIKFDLTLNPLRPAQARALKMAWGDPRLVWIAASTHEGEEAQILSTWQALCVSFPELKLILVPRHPERTPHFLPLVEELGVSFARRSQTPEPAPQHQIYIGDTLGELDLLYGLADIVFMGGTWVPVGGHNMLEAALWGLPILTGPYLHNFIEISEQLTHVGALKTLDTPDALLRTMMQWLENAEARQQAGQAGHAILRKNQGAIQRTLDILSIPGYFSE
jgi:3-deoxy-D-manno-octulosonic-acid transferase